MSHTLSHTPLAKLVNARLAELGIRRPELVKSLAWVKRVVAVCTPPPADPPTTIRTGRSRA